MKRTACILVARDILETTIRQNQSELNRNVMNRIDRTLYRVMQDIRHMAKESEIETFMMRSVESVAIRQQDRDLLLDLQDNILLTGPWQEILLVNRDTAGSAIPVNPVGEPGGSGFVEISTGGSDRQVDWNDFWGRSEGVSPKR